ncbi:ArsR/SmtB family transcription factor [Haloarchaeobius sp. DFWS5]|uniref:ArsR/SmtB family transcription factor n=1 Tax=Haloarchaeobius sp. DFWS5 TaxID=3446114 RepID=UPI003EBB6D74
MAANPDSLDSTCSTRRTLDDDTSTAELLDLFGDEYTRRIFEAVAERPRTGRAVAEAAAVSRPTAYRRLNALRDAGLVVSEMTISESGHHRERFETAVDGLSLTVSTGTIEVTVHPSD